MNFGGLARGLWSDLGKLISGATNDVGGRR
jgi:hypothetical protein